MQRTVLIAAGLLALLLFLPQLAVATNSCLLCHTEQSSGYSEAHGFARDNCVICHLGDASASAPAAAHAGMLPFPGNLDNAEQACGGCHSDKVESVTNSQMHTGHGMVDVTRRLVDGEPGHSGTAALQSLGHGPADSMLRKLCASCHLGQPKTAHQLNPTTDRGGGCLACHINAYPDNAHPALTRQVSDGRCFGCHSRSGRISLNYTGLAEIDPADGDRPLRLADGRAVERMPEDVHYRAGMGCIDCHTGAALMGDGSSPSHKKEAVDISCIDCHQDATSAQTAGKLATTRRGTPLPHLKYRDSALWLQSKTSGRSLQVPQLGAEHAALTQGHERIECATCHSQWAPRCFGCHMSYDAQGEQWDHVERKLTPGRWSEQRDNIDNGLAALGVNEHGRIELFVPGMIMTVEHPEWPEPRFTRTFAPLSPHTSGPARSCNSCHRDPGALGLGEGVLEERAGKVHFTPHQKHLTDGLPSDAWIDLAGEGGTTPRKGLRPLNLEEIKAILNAPMPEG